MPRQSALFKTEARLLSSLAHPTRLQILEILRDGEACVCHIQATLRQRQSYVSQQLMALRQPGIVANRKEGLRVYYRISDPQILAVLDDVRAVTGLNDEDMQQYFPEQGKCNCPQCAGTT